MSLAKYSLVFTSLVLSVAGFILPAAEVKIKPDLLEHLQSQQTSGALGQLAAKNIQLTIRRGDESMTVAATALPNAPFKISGWGLSILSEEQSTQLALAMAAWQIKQKTASSADLLGGIFTYRRQIKRYSRVAFLVPGLAAGFAFLLFVFGTKRWVNGIVGLLCAAITAAFCWKMNALTLPVSFGTVRWMEGGWMILGGYLGLAAASVFGLFVNRRQGA